MSINGEYIRLTAAEWERATADPEWALEFAEALLDGEDEPHGEAGAPTGSRHFTTHKTWHLLEFLLARADFPVNVVHGEQPLGDADDWGYGPPRHLPADRVRLAPDALRRLTYDQLIDGVDPNDLVTAEIYPQSWPDRASLEWARDTFADLTAYLTAAAEAKDAVVVWLD
ncbi:YfbM family protein [Streptomyces sp. NPDC090025]|uniref:YfbM family protein n=1 Tax=Streptomyces sp. NPDC090025 TaxID=3365922 RepID=UPI0038350DB4